MSKKECDNRHFANGWRASTSQAVFNWRGQSGDKQRPLHVLISCLRLTEALISDVFKGPVLWDHRIKDYHNRDFVDKELRNLSQTLDINIKYYYIAFVFGLYTNLRTEDGWHF
jgi:hypothetical protein